MFLQHNAADVWADMIESGIAFLIPDDVARLPVDKQAKRLAAAEAKRMARARLFYLDETASQIAVSAGSVFADRGVYALGSAVIPAKFGFLVWAEDVSTSASGAGIIACSWEVRHDSVWVSWWSDLTTDTRTRAASGEWTQQTAATVQQLYGVLAFERERVLPFGTGVIGNLPPDVTMDGRVQALTNTTISTWALLAGRHLATRELPGPTRRTVLGVPAIPGADDTITVATAPPDFDPDDIWR